MEAQLKSILSKVHSHFLQLIYKIKIGKNSKVQPGSTIEGGEYINIGNKSFIGKNAWLACYDKVLNETYHPSIQIGNEVSIGKYSCITAINKIQIGDGTLISEYFYVSDHTHGFNPLQGSPIKQKLISKGPVVIGENNFIGYRVTILPNVTIGKHCVIGSHSVVTKNIPDYSMVAGVPAKIIKKFDFQKNDWINVID